MHQPRLITQSPTYKHTHTMHSHTLYTHIFLGGFCMVISLQEAMLKLIDDCVWLWRMMFEYICAWVSCLWSSRCSDDNSDYTLWSQGVYRGQRSNHSVAPSSSFLAWSHGRGSATQNGTVWYSGNLSEWANTDTVMVILTLLLLLSLWG